MYNNFNEIYKHNLVFFNKINDIFSYVRYHNSYKFSKFFNEQELEFSKIFIRKNNLQNYMFFGGYNNAKRQIIGVFPDYIYDNKIFLFPLTPIVFKYPKKYILSHQNFLGYLTSLNINRNMIGDICIFEGETIIFVHNNICNFIIDNTIKISNVGVSASIDNNYYNNLLIEDKFSYINGTVSTLRLDCVISFILNCSRSKSSKIIKSRLVFLNSIVCDDLTKILCVNDTVTIRGFGKYILSDVGSRSRKDRLFIIVKKYI